MPGNPASLILTPSDASGPVGSSLTFTVSVADEFGTPVNGVNVSISLSPSGGGIVPMTVPIVANGTATFTLTDITRGHLEVTATLDALSATAETDFGAPVFIDEFHYDNPGTDTGEFVEIAGPAGTDLNGYSLVLYNGGDGHPYNTVGLLGNIPGASGLGVVVVSYPSNGIQNGSPDGIALVAPDGSVVQFLSYEGNFRAVGGPANNLQSTDVGVFETGTVAGTSISLVKTPSGDTIWQVGPETAGALNPGFVACYRRGTLINTSKGDVAVEELAIGDQVVTGSGAWRPIKWIGRRHYSGRFIMGRADILPVCFKAGSLGEGLPKRDLWISPHHAMYFNTQGEAVLIEAKDLINGFSVVQAEHVDEVEYFHIELDTHDVILAEGTLSETFVDDDSRGMFHNACEYAELYPDDAMRAARYCAPRLDSGYEVEAVRRNLAKHAGLPSDRRDAETLRGHIDVVSPRLIEGWAQSADHPEAPVCLDIYADGKLIGQTLANRYRADLKAAGLGSGHHSFSFAVPDGPILWPAEIEVRRSLDGSALPRAGDRRSRAA